MLSYEEAHRRAEAKLAELAREQAEGAAVPDLVILDELVQERARGWVFPYNTRRWLTTRNPLDGAVGNGPILVDKQDGAVHVVPSGGSAAWLDAYDRTGQPPESSGGVMWISDGEPPDFSRRSTARSFVLEPTELAVLLQHVSSDLPLDETAREDLGVTKEDLAAADRSLRDRGLLLVTFDGETTVAAAFAPVLRTLVAPGVLCMLTVSQGGSAPEHVNFSCTTEAIVANRVDASGRHLILVLDSVEELSAVMLATTETELAAEAPSEPEGDATVEQLRDEARAVAHLAVAALPAEPAAARSTISWIEARGQLWLVDTTADLPQAHSADPAAVRAAIEAAVVQVAEAASSSLGGSA